MSAARVLPLLPLLLIMGGCTLLQEEPSPDRNAALRLEQGLAALNAGLFTPAFNDLAWVYSHCPGHEAGYQALAGLASLELDPRNQSGREALGTELLGRLIQHPGTPQWARPLSEMSYLMALALGAPPSPDAPASDTPATDAPATALPPDTTPAGGPAAMGHGSTVPQRLPVPVRQEPDLEVYGCGASVEDEEWVGPELPTLPGPSLVALLNRSEADRTRLATRADSLTQALTATQQELQATQAELERIRKTLKP